MRFREEEEITDKDRLDWLEQFPHRIERRLSDIAWECDKHGMSVRQAINYLMGHRDEDPDD